MPAPVSFINIAALPFSRTVTAAEFNPDLEIWFRYVATTRMILGSFTNESPGVFLPRTTVYESDGTTPVLGGTTLDSKGLYRVLAIGTYYIRITNFYGTTAFDFTTNFAAGPIWTGIVPTGFPIIPDDSDGFPASVLDPSSGAVLGYLFDTPAGEIGQTLQRTGVSLWHHSGTGGPLSLLDRSFQTITTVAVPGIVAGQPFPLIATDDTQFYVLDRASGVIHTVSSAGSVAGPIATLPAPVQGYATFGVTRDGSIAYWTDALGFPTHTPALGGSPSIHRHDLVADSALADLYTVPALLMDTGSIGITGVNGHPGDILVLPDGSVVTWYQNDTANERVLIHVSAAGVLLHSYTYMTEFIDHINRTSEPGMIGVWFYTDTTAEQGRIGTLALATGAESSHAIPFFEQGSNLSGPAMFGVSSSCTFVMQFTSPPASPPVDISTPCPCPTTPGAGEVPTPTGTFPAPTYTCEGGGLVEAIADLPSLEDCWL